MVGRKKKFPPLGQPVRLPCTGYLDKFFKKVSPSFIYTCLFSFLGNREKFEIDKSSHQVVIEKFNLTQELTQDHSIMPPANGEKINGKICTCAQRHIESTSETIRDMPPSRITLCTAGSERRSRRYFCAFFLAGLAP